MRRARLGETKDSSQEAVCVKTWTTKYVASRGTRGLQRGPEAYRGDPRRSLPPVSPTWLMAASVWMYPVLALRRQRKAKQLQSIKGYVRFILSTHYSLRIQPSSTHTPRP